MIRLKAGLLLLAAALGACQRLSPAPTAAPSPIATPLRAPAGYQPECFPEDEWVRCQDGPIGLEFQYPASWGFISSARLQSGSCGGQSLVYSFEPWWTGPLNGGASQDYCQPEAGSIQGFSGFPDEVTSGPGLLAICQQVFPQAVFCQPVSEQIWLVGLFPDAQAVCLAIPGQVPQPRLAVAIDLPPGRPVGGLVLAQVFISGADEASLFEPLGGPSPNRGLCRQEAATQAYQDNVRALAEEIINGQADRLTMERVEAIRQLAESVRID